MPPKRLKRPRNIRITGHETPAERQARTAVRFLMDNRHYHSILKAMQDGVPNSKIAETGIARGWFDQNQKTVVAYLQYFRKHQPNLCKATPHLDSEGAPLGYSDLFDGNDAILDEEVELVRLIKLQQARVGIAFRNERGINMLMASNRREVTELRELIMELARLRGVVKSSMDINVMGYSQVVKEDLKGIEQHEQQRSVIATLVKDLVSLTNE